MLFRSGVLTSAEVDELRGELSQGSIDILPSVALGGEKGTPDVLSALLPMLFADHEQLIVIPAAAEVSADITALSTVDFAETLLAAKHDVRKNRSSGLTLMRRIASSFGDDHTGALDFVFATHAGMNEDFVPFDPQIAVLNLAGLRSEGVVERVLGLVQEHDLSYIDAMQMIVKGRYSDLGDDWNIHAQ